MSGASKKFFEFTPSRRLENALLANRPNIVSLVNGGTTQVVKTLQGNTYHYISNVDDVEALVGLESQIDNNN